MPSELNVTTDLMNKVSFTFVQEINIINDLEPHLEGLMEVLNFLDKSQVVYVHDDHNRGDIIRKASAMVILANGNICESFTNTTHCLNPLYIEKKDNTLHLSTWSCGGNIYPHGHESFQQSVEEYNKSMEGFSYSKKIVAYKVF